MKGLTALAACCTLSLFSTSLLADDASCKNVRIGAVGWTDVVATTAVASELLHGLGYEIDVPMSTFYDLPEVGREVVLSTHYAVKEDGVALFGFLTEAERRLFREVQKVTGVGAKIALAVLSGASVDDFARLVQSGDVAALTRVPGIGGQLGVEQGGGDVGQTASLPQAGVRAMARNLALLALHQDHGHRQIDPACEGLAGLVNGFQRLAETIRQSTRNLPNGKARGQGGACGQRCHLGLRKGKGLARVDSDHDCANGAGRVQRGDACRLAPIDQHMDHRAVMPFGIKRADQGRQKGNRQGLRRSG